MFLKHLQIDVFLELSCFYNDPTDVNNLISGPCAFSKTSLNIWKFKVHILLKPSLENVEHYFTSVWDECNCVIVWSPNRGFPSGLEGKATACSAGDWGSIPESGWSPGEENGTPLQYSCPEIPWTEEPGRLQSMGSQRVEQDWATSLHLILGKSQKVPYAPD